MVVLAASITSKSGKALVSRQFVGMSRIRIEGYLAAFPKLVGIGNQHTYIETDSVRYVYQPIESLYLLLVTNKQSNILEDLETLRLLAKLIVKNRNEKGGFTSLQSMGSGRVDTGFNSDTIISTSGCFGSGCPPASASAPPKGLGMKLRKTQRTNQFLESLKAEGEVIVEDVRTRIGQSSAAAPPTDPVTLTHEEKLNVTLKQDGGIGNFDLQGMLSLQILNQDDGHIQVQVETGGNPGIIFKIHPNINKDLFSGENILGFKDPNRSFSAAQAGDGLPLLKWRMQSADESLLPLSINCWPSVSGNETHVNLEYETPPIFDLQDVVISIPLPALREAPRVPVPQIDGDWSYNSRKSILEWSILLIDKSNRSGSMEFVIPAEIDASDLFPISVRFTSTSTFSGLKVVNVVPLKGGNAPKFSQRTLLSTDNYQVV